jgi:four helix bundle protein
MKTKATRVSILKENRVLESQNSKFKSQNDNSKFKSDLKDRCFKLSLDTITLLDELPNKRAAWVIADQLIRSITSIGANLIEARASSSRLEFKKFYEISLKSANESIYWLELLDKSNLGNDKNKINKLLTEVNEIARMIAAGVIKLKAKNL